MHAGERGVGWSWIVGVAGSLASAVVLLWSAPAFAAVTSTVISTGDGAYASPFNDCRGGTIFRDNCTLRAAIQRANANGGGTINFDIPGAGVHTISVGATGNGALPTINRPVTLDATTQPGYAGSPLIVLTNGSASSFDGLDVATSDVTIKGFAINGFLSGISAQTPFTSSDFRDITIAANYIGTDATGAASMPNLGPDVVLQRVTGVIGGPGTNDGNLIADSTSDGIVLDDVAGSVIEGNTIVHNAHEGIRLLDISGGNTIGGTSAAAGNTISSNGDAGVVVEATSLCGGNVVQGNLINSNAGPGVMISTGSGSCTPADVNLIGGSSAGAGNAIINNQQGVVIQNGVVSGAQIEGNSIANSTIGLGIDLGNDGVTANDRGDGDTGPNGLQNFPFVTSAALASGGGVAVAGSLNSTASSSLTVDLYASPACSSFGYGEASQWLGSEPLTTNANGNGVFSHVFVPSSPVGAGYVITATATDPSGNTSEFSPCTRVASAGTPEVSVQDFLFAPATVTAAQGRTVQWNFAGPLTHTVTDASGMKLYDSGARAAGQSFLRAFRLAGNFPYRSTGEATPMNGTIRVPVKLTPASGTTSTSFTVTWASAAPPTGLVEDIQIQRPGSTSFVNFLTAQTGTSATFVPDAGAGTYSFRARERKTADNTHSAFSAPTSITVGP